MRWGPAPAKAADDRVVRESHVVPVRQAADVGMSGRDPTGRRHTSPAADHDCHRAARAGDAGRIGLQWIDGALVAEGAGYHVTFDRGALRFLPALGRTAPADRPVTFAVETIGRDDAVLYRAVASCLTASTDGSPPTHCRGRRGSGSASAASR